MNTEQLKKEFEACSLGSFDLATSSSVYGSFYIDKQTESAWLGFQAAAKSRDELIGKLYKALDGSEKLLQDAQDIMRLNIIPNGISNKDAIAAYIALLDNTRQRMVQRETNAALAEAAAQGYGE